MVIGKERTSWYSDHPLECTCAACESKRADDRRFRMTQGRKGGPQRVVPVRQRRQVQALPRGVACLSPTTILFSAVASKYNG